MIGRRIRRAARGAEAGAMLALSLVLVRVVPFRFTLRALRHACALERPGEPEADARRSASVAARIDRLAPRLPFPVRCLPRALGGWLLLRRRGISAQIRFGVARRDGAFAAHAWLVAGGRVVIGGDEAANFTPIGAVGGSAPAR